MMTVSITERDYALLDELCAFRAVPVEQLAVRFFSKNPFTGALNTNPHKACERRLAALSAAGFVMNFYADDGLKSRVLVGLGPKAHELLGARARRAVPIRKLAHHTRTMDALKIVEESVRARGGRVLSSRIEQQVRSDQQRGRFLVAGDTFDPFPDAVCTAVLPAAEAGEHGEPRRVEIAVEYATSKYTDEDIRGKHEGFTSHGDGGYDEVLWFADRLSTRERVKRVTGGPCSIMS
jgi:hypothetical protein